MHPAARRSLLFYFLFVLTPVIAGVIFLSTALVTVKNAKATSNESERARSEVTALYKESLEDAIWDFRLNDLGEICRRIASTPRVSAVTLSKGEKYACRIGEVYTSPSYVESILKVSPGLSGEQWTLRVYANIPTVTQIFWQTLPEYLIPGFVLLLLIAAVFQFMLQHYVLQPISALRSNLMLNGKQISALQLIDEDGSIEISELIRGYNNMVKTIVAEESDKAVLADQLRYHVSSYEKLSVVASSDWRFQSLVDNIVDLSYHGTTFGLLCYITNHPQTSVRESSWLFLESIATTIGRLYEQSQRLLAEEKLIESQGTLVSALELISGVLLFAPDGTLVACNNLARQLLNPAASGEFQLQNTADFVARVQTQSIDSCQRLLDWFASPVSTIEIDIECIDKRWLSYSIALTKDQSIVCMVRETTNLRHMQLSLEQDRRVKELGRVGSAITHDFNNFLQGVSGNLEIALTQLPVTGRVTALLQNSLRQIGIAKGTTRQMLDFLRRTKTSPKPINPEFIIDDLRESISDYQRASDVILGEIRTKQWIYADRSQLIRALNNLASNSIYESRGHRVTLQIIIEDCDEKINNKPSLRLLFRDNCGGFPEDVLRRAIEPFFSSKPQGQGTGLGLTIVKDFVESSGGRMTLGNVDGGAQVTLLLPACAPVTPKNKAGATKFDRAYIPAGYQIIIIEDSTELLGLLEQLLEQNTLFKYMSLFELEADLSSLPHDIDLIVSDVNLPDGSGLMAIERIEAHLGKSVPGLFITGDGSQREVRKLPRGKSLLQKPFAIRDLYREVNGLIKSGRSHRLSAAPPDYRKRN